MSAIPSTQGIPTVTAAHRDNAPIWPFHTWIAYMIYAVATVVYRANTWEDQFTRNHPLTTAFGVLAGFALALSAVIALVVFA